MRLYTAFALLALVIGLIAATWMWSGDWIAQRIETYLQENPQPFSPSLLTDIRRPVSTPGALRGPLEQTPAQLTIAGILKETNRHRSLQGLPALRAQESLNSAAVAKLNDMFTRQYFDHVGPDGAGPAYWVESAGYEYLAVGENLALGNFANDAELVQAWMDSPGHRANILSSAYQEIGIATSPGVFQGARVWLAVQTFATPQAACPTLDAALRASFDEQRGQSEQLEAKLAGELDILNARRVEIQSMYDAAARLAEEGNQKIEEGNEEIERGNEIYRQTGDEEAARPHWERGQQLQQEGQALLEQAQALHEEARRQQSEWEEARRQYNEQVASLESINTQIRKLVQQLNEQINTFNTCVTQLAP